MDDSQAVTGPGPQGRLGQPKLRLWGAQPPLLIITIILNSASRQKETYFSIILSDNWADSFESFDPLLMTKQQWTVQTI